MEGVTKVSVSTWGAKHPSYASADNKLQFFTNIAFQKKKANLDHDA